MLSVLGNRDFRQLFLGQTLALLGTGLATVALALLAHDLAGAAAGAVLATALTIKMVAYVGIAPVIGVLASRVPRRALLAGTNVVRAGVACALPFVDSVWQIYVLIFVLQLAAATFTPTLQATVPDVVPERDYTNALAISRLAHDLEALGSPLLAAVLLTLLPYQGLFFATAVGFCAAVALVLSVTLPHRGPDRSGRPWQQATQGIRAFAATPRLRGLMALNLAVAAPTAFVLVNTIVIVRSRLGLPETSVAIALASFGAGSMAAALVLPRISATWDNTALRRAMTTAALGLAGVPAGAAALATVDVVPLWPLLLSTWFLLGCGAGVILILAPRLLRASCHEADRPAVYAAQFSLSHAWFLGTYPLAGWLGTAAGLPAGLLTVAAVCLTACVAALLLWPRRDPAVVPHAHANTTDAHVADARRHGDLVVHEHVLVIDDLHRRWSQGIDRAVDAVRVPR